MKKLEDYRILDLDYLNIDRFGDEQERSLYPIVTQISSKRDIEKQEGADCITLFETFKKRQDVIDLFSFTEPLVDYPDFSRFWKTWEPKILGDEWNKFSDFDRVKYLISERSIVEIFDQEIDFIISDGKGDKPDPKSIVPDKLKEDLLAIINLIREDGTHRLSKGFNSENLIDTLQHKYLLKKTNEEFNGWLHSGSLLLETISLTKFNRKILVLACSLTVSL